MFAVFLNGLNSKNSSRSIVWNIFSVYFFILGFKICYSEYSFVIQIFVSGIRIISYISDGMCRKSAWPVNKQVLAFTLFVRNSSYPVYDDCSMKKQPISTAVVFEFRELLKWITKSYWNLGELSKCKHICHRDRFFSYITLWVFHNSNKSKLLTVIKRIHMFNCSTNCLCPIRIATNGSTSFSMRTSSRLVSSYFIPSTTHQWLASYP